MFESLTPGDWIQVAVLVVSVVAPLGFWMVRMERHASNTATTNGFIAESLNSLKDENRILHGRIDETKADVKELDGRVDKHGETLAVHETHLTSLLNKGSCGT